MRQYRSDKIRNINSLTKSAYNKIVQEDGLLFGTFAKLRDSSVIQSFVVEWQMQTNDLKKFNEILVKDKNGFYLH